MTMLMDVQPLAVPMADVEMAKDLSEDQPKDSLLQNACLPHELWLINGHLNMFIWLRILQIMADYDHRRCFLEGERSSLQLFVNQLQCNATYAYHDDVGPVAMLKTFVERINQVC